MLRTIWILMLLTALLLFLLSIILLFVWRVPELMDELSGRKAKRQIQRLHELNVGTGTFDKLSTNEIYSGISSGTLMNSDLLMYPVEGISSLEDNMSDAGITLSSPVDDEVPTGFINENEIIQTDFLDDSKPVIIEEQGSIL